MIVAVEAHSGKAYRFGFGKSVTRSNLAKANQNRDCRIFEEYAYYMMELARNLNDTTIFNLGGTVYAFDSTTVELCLAVFCWAKFRKKISDRNDKGRICRFLPVRHPGPVPRREDNPLQSPDRPPHQGRLRSGGNVGAQPT